MAFGGIALKSVSMFLRIVEFCCAALILGVFSYYLSVLHNHHLSIATYIRAVEGISGAAALYTICAILLVCCLGGIAIFSFLGMLLDLAFTGAFVYVAWALRGGAGSCRGNVNTPLGSGNVNSDTISNGSGGATHLVSLRTACKLETASFAVAIIGALFFFFSIFLEFALMRHHKKEKAFGPSPNNGYTAGSPKRKFWQRKQKRRDMEMAGGLAKQHPDSLPTHATPSDARMSYATDTTAVGEQTPYNKYGHTQPIGHPTGHTTTTTTHTPYAHDSPYSHGTTEMPAGSYHATSNSNGTF